MATMRPLAFGAVFTLALIVACSSSDDATPDGGTPTVDGGTTQDSGTSRPAPTPLPALTNVYTTVDRIYSPASTKEDATTTKNPALVENLAAELSLGEIVEGAGEAYLSITIDGSPVPTPGPNAKRLLRFAHLADMQVADDESPMRLGLFDAAGPTSGALRPQDPALCRMANAAVRTINALHAKDPLSFTLLGGDSADSAQSNEIDWVLRLLSGSPSLECDSGNDDDPVAGPDNDGKDPFVASGLAMPWKWLTGNHDVEIQGNLVVDATTKATSIGSLAGGGTRRYDVALPGTLDHGNVTVADPRRILLDGTELVTRIADHGDGHGLGAAEKSSGRATYTFDVPGTALRFLVIDTAHAGGGAEGCITQREVDRIIKPSLDAAKAAGKTVVLASHHPTDSLSDGTGLGSAGPEPDALTADQWRALVGTYDNVVLSLVGHDHRARVTPLAPAGGHAWWELMTPAIADWPHQLRTIEIFDQDDGWLMIRATCVDVALENDPVTADGKKRGTVDLLTGWLPQGTMNPTDRNVEVWIRKP